jgi:pimeloyl-ACP methyl ester carboxylesterase
MQRASKDGTTIGYDKAGSGPAVILIDGALAYRGVGPNRRLGEALSETFTVYTYDRRGRGESGDSDRYAIEREVEDIASLIEAAGGSAHLYGISSGGALALEAATRMPDEVRTVAVYEIPYIVDDSRPPVADTFQGQLGELLGAGRGGDAVKLFMRDAVRLPSFLVAAMPLFPGWSKNKGVAPTLAYDVAIMGDGQKGRPLPQERWSAVNAPVLVASGGKSPEWVSNAAAQLGQILPNGRQQTLAGQRHYVKAQALAPVLTEFFAGLGVAASASPDTATSGRGPRASLAS